MTRRGEPREVDTASNRRIERSCDPMPPAAMGALEKLHSIDRRVVEIRVGRDVMVVSFAVVLYLCGHGPYDMPRIWQCARKRVTSRRRPALLLRMQTADDVLTWPIAKERAVVVSYFFAGDDGDD